MTDESRRAIAWFRRDLRLTDNRVLEAATRDAERVWPVFVADPDLLDAHASAPARIAWFEASARAVDERLREHGSDWRRVRRRGAASSPGGSSSPTCSPRIPGSRGRASAPSTPPSIGPLGLKRTRPSPRRDGRTGFPFVDAGMRQLAATGWMHNRARLVTASFLVKDLGVDWRRGASVFAERLLDADVQQNHGNWQWVGAARQG